MFGVIVLEQFPSFVVVWIGKRGPDWVTGSLTPSWRAEFVHAFEREAVDGLGLLTLQRSNRACVGMSDSEWLLLKVCMTAAFER